MATLQLWLAALSLAYVNSQLLEFYESQSPFSTESVNPSVSRAIKTNKLKPSTNYWDNLQTRSTYVTNQGRQGQNLNSYRRPKHYSSTQSYQTPATYVENYDVTSKPYPTKSSVKPYTPRHSYEGHFNVDYELQAISKSKYENSYKKETHHQAAYDPYDISRPNLKVVHNQEWKAEAGPRYPSDGNNYHSKVPPRYPSENYETPSRYRDSRYNESRSYCNPDAPPACFDYRFGMCVEDNSYPEDDIRVIFSHLAPFNHLPLTYNHIVGFYFR